MTETSAPPRAPADSGGASQDDRDPFLDADPEALARRDPSRTAAQWAELQAFDRAEIERREHLPIVDRPDDVPTFADENEEVAFWDTHQMGPALEAWCAAQQAGRPQPAPPIDDSRVPLGRPASPPKQAAPVSLRLEADTVRRLRILAEKRGTKYQTLLKQFVLERLYEEEKRDHLVG